MPIHFRNNSVRALSDEFLQSALRRTGTHFQQGRNRAVEATPDWEDLRTRAHEIKKEVIHHLNFYLTQLIENIEKKRGHVHHARTAEEACRVVEGIARLHRVQTIVKSKSMVSEEIELNAHLQKAGFYVVETDLGEFILQLAGEKPSHIIAPAVHKSREQVAMLFAQKLGFPEEMARETSIEALTEIARKYLRGKFLQAEAGVTGVNFAVADTGTLVIVENEGNARFTTTYPKVHIALMGIEKIIPRWEDLSIFLTLLPRSATGQMMTSYVSFLNGSKGEDEEDGPAELHLVLLDNGRSKMLHHPLLQQTLYCIRCGACLNFCPVYQTVGGHAYGGVYSGPIGAILTPQMQGFPHALPLPYASSLCSACADVCPVKIPIPQILLSLRHQSRKSDTLPFRSNFPLERLAFYSWSVLLSYPWLYRRIFPLLLKFSWLLSHPPFSRVAPAILSSYLKEHALPPLPSKSFYQRWKEYEH